MEYLIRVPNTGASRHWRYISSFHGPWLQLPPEVLESLAYSNYASPRPRPIDPAVFFDLVKIRRLVEDATDLSVRATNGIALSSLNNSSNGSNGIFGGGGPATLGFGLGRNGIAKLSRERRHRMRELATQKLSHAYQLDEIAASVATMQSTSSLEEVAKIVLQRSPTDSDAKYVHFFHEKIPSRRLAQSTDLRSLDEIIRDRPTEAGPLRTRGVTRIFKEDFADAARDLTDGLLICRYMSQHKSDTPEVRLVSTIGEPEIKSGGGHKPSYEVKVEDEDQPNGLEAQFLFQRAGVYLTLACQYINPSLDGSMSHDNFDSTAVGGQEKNTDSLNLESSINPISHEAHQRQLEARKLVKAYAKRALRDYTNYLSKFEYTPGLSPEVAVDFLRKVNTLASGVPKSKEIPIKRLLEMSGNSGLSGGILGDALIPHGRSDPVHHPCRPFREVVSYPRLPLPPADVYPVSVLFSSSPPPNLPPFPSSQALLQSGLIARDQIPDQLSTPTWAQVESYEAVTYHPLLTDALHSLLLCHSLLQTSSKEHLRHAHMAARLARVCDGYPIFVACRSPSRADWIEVIRQANNWLGLEKSWENLCTPAPLPGRASAPKKEETEAESKERRMQESILEALADEGVVDDATFRAAIAVRERRAEEQNSADLAQGGGSSQRWAQDDGRGYPMSSGRAEAISKWIREAPQVVEGLGKGKVGKKGKGRKQSP